jgi:CO/xanthine dehydrogenase FAD-binding subunit
LVTLHEGRIASLRLVIGAVADRLIDASQALSSFVGQPWSEALANRIGQQCAVLVAEPLSDHQGDGAWRRAMAGVVARRALAAAVARAQGSKE